MIRALMAAFAVALSAPADPHDGVMHGKKAVKPISTEDRPFGREGDPRRRRARSTLA